MVTRRNVQLTGQKSFTITLPKNWIRAHNIQRKQPLYMKIDKNGSLVINPLSFSQEQQEIVVMTVENQMEPDQVFRSVLGQYMKGKNILKIFTNGKFKPEILEVIRSLTEKINSLEITEETLNSIYLEAKDLFTVENFQLLVESMGNSVIRMTKDILSVLKDHEISQIEAIYKREEEINHDFWEMNHVANLIFSQTGLSSESLININNLSFTALNFEQIADKFMVLLHHYEKIPENHLPNLVEEYLHHSIEELCSILEKIIPKLVDTDFQVANEIISVGEKLVKASNSFLYECTTFSQMIVEIFKMVDSLAGIGRNLQNIGENLINRQ